MSPTLPRPAAAFALLSLLTAPRPRGATGWPLTAPFGGSQRAASALRGRNTTPLLPNSCLALHSSTTVLATHSQSDGSVERPYNHGVVPLKNSNRKPKKDTHGMQRIPIRYANTYRNALPPTSQLYNEINEPKTTTQYPTKIPTKQHAPHVPMSHLNRAHTNRHTRRTKRLRRHATADSRHARDQSDTLPRQRSDQRCEGPRDRTHHPRVQPPSIPPLRGDGAKRLDPHHQSHLYSGHHHC